MITDLQNFFLKHNKWLFSALLLVIIVTFVLTIGNQSFFGGGQTFEVRRAEYHGYDLNNPRDVQRIQEHAEISLQIDPFMQFDPGLGSAARSLEEYALLRVAALGLADQWLIPQPSEEALTAYISSLSTFVDPTTGVFDRDRYSEYIAQLSTGYEEGILARVLREDYRISQVRDALGGPGYVLPFEARTSFAQNQTEWILRVATLSLDAFDGNVEPTEESLQTFYEQNPGRYTLPERIQASAVFFNADAFVDQTAIPSEAEIEGWFNQFRFRYQRQPSFVETDPPADVTLDEAREEVIADLRREAAVSIAKDQSDAFTNHLYNEQIVRHSDTFDAAVEQFGGVVRALEPFARNEVPSDFGVPPAALQSVWTFAGPSNRYFGDLAETPNGAVLVVIDEVLPEALQPLSAVREEVLNDYQAEEKRRLFAQQAQEWEEQIHAAVAGGEDFESVAEATGFSVETTETFTPASLPETVEPSVWNNARHLREGQISDAIVDEHGTHFAFVVKKSQPPAEAASEEIAAFRERISEQRASTSGWFALREWRNNTLHTVRPVQEAL